jgi:hypothetical protein
LDLCLGAAQVSRKREITTGPWESSRFRGVCSGVMEIRAVVVGAKIPQESLVAAAPKGSRSPSPDRLAKAAHRGLAWVLLPYNPKRSAIDALARSLGAALSVFEVEVTLGMRGEELAACSYTAPGRKRERDLTDSAVETLATWTDGAGASDEEVAAVELAWFLAGRG